MANVTQDLREALDHGPIQRIERLGPVDRHGRDFAFFENQVFHNFSCLATRIFSDR